MSDSPVQAETAYDFGSKYTKQNLVTRLLLDRFFGAVETAIHRAAPKNVLEVGCGEGFSTQRIQRMLAGSARFEACDVEQRLVNAATANNPSVKISRDSIYALSRADGAVDLVLALEVLEHLEDPARALRELVRATSRWLVLSVPREPIWRIANFARGRYVRDLGNTPGHIQHWSTSGFARFVGEVADVRLVRTPLPWTVLLAEKRS
jgi:2-polyprenyl-3-methyl-5-hydroxy-6-metoxy-1,4-benzoquinol methylase